jgi:C4-dicarboxylate-specific signal transduction histidine kinase
LVGAILEYVNLNAVEEFDQRQKTSLSVNFGVCRISTQSSNIQKELCHVHPANRQRKAANSKWHMSRFADMPVVKHVISFDENWKMVGNLTNESYCEV